MNTPFTSGEVQAAIQNNKSSGRDNIKAGQLKYGTENIPKEIATIYNQIARTGKHPNEINRRVLTVIQKPAKPKGLIGNLRIII